LQLLAHRAFNPPPSSSLAEEGTPLAPPPCGGARFPTLAAECEKSGIGPARWALTRYTTTPLSADNSTT